MSTEIDKIRGCLWGIVLGDALGAPLEGYSAEKILEIHGERVTDFKQPLGHKWFDGQPLGFWTDDTQLSLAVLKGLLEAGFDLDVQAKHHALAMAESTEGWGYTTQDSIRNLKNGVHWSKSGITDNPHRGSGNGVPMKLAPLAVWSYIQGYPEYKKIIQFSAMSHYTEMSAYAAVAHYHAIVYCLGCTPDNFQQKSFLDEITKEAYVAGFVENAKLDPPLNKLKDNLRSKFELLYNMSDGIPFEKGGCYVYESLPFTYAYFLRDPTIEGFYDVINAGGDTDTNGSMFGALLGALHGINVFPQKLIDGIQNKDHIEKLIEDFIRTICVIPPMCRGWAM